MKVGANEERQKKVEAFTLVGVRWLFAKQLQEYYSIISHADQCKVENSKNELSRWYEWLCGRTNTVENSRIISRHG